jgi:Tfp pilus assembly protein PilZ
MPSHEEFARIPYVRRCLVTRGPQRLDAMLCDLSVLGVYVTFPGSLTPSMPEVGETVGISFLLPGDHRIEGDATVTWQNLEEPQQADSPPPGLGLRFVTMSPDDHQRIEELVLDYRHSPHPRIAAPPPYTGFLRMPYVQPCLLVGGAGTWKGVVCNISLIGAYVATDPIPPAGEGVRVLFWLPQEGSPTEVEGEVVWVNPEEPPRADSLPAGCGIRFLDLPSPVRSHLEALVAAYQSVPRETL